MRDLLHSHFVKQYAVYWERLGLELGLAEDDIDFILRNHYHHPNFAEACCAEVLETWLRKFSFATWAKLDDAIKEIILPYTDHQNGNHSYCNCRYVVQ